MPTRARTLRSSPSAELQVAQVDAQPAGRQVVAVVQVGGARDGDVAVAPAAAQVHVGGLEEADGAREQQPGDDQPARAAGERRGDQHRAEADDADRRRRCPSARSVMTPSSDAAATTSSAAPMTTRPAPERHGSRALLMIGGFTALAGQQHRRGEVDEDAGAAQEREGDEADADEVRVDSEVAADAGGDAGEHAAVLGAFEALRGGVGGGGFSCRVHDVKGGLASRRRTIGNRP